jgi:hypothetical protein
VDLFWLAIQIEETFFYFNENGLGNFKIPISKFSEGHYMMHIQPTSDIDLRHEKIYMFRVKRLTL